MTITGIDHIVLVVADINKTLEFYSDVLGMTAQQNFSGKWSLVFGSNKISLQQLGEVPKIARQTLPGTANFCVLTDTPIADIAERLGELAIPILEGPAEKEGATGAICSIYFYDPDGNLVEVANLQ